MFIGGTVARKWMLLDVRMGVYIVGVPASFLMRSNLFWTNNYHSVCDSSDVVVVDWLLSTGLPCSSCFNGEQQHIDVVQDRH